MRPANSDRASFGTILLVGGYGQVGLELARYLAPRQPGRVVLGGRTLAAAHAAAKAIGHGTRAVQLDADDPDQPGTRTMLCDASVVVACAGHTSPKLAEASLRAGAHYIDVTADGALIAGIEALDSVASEHGVAAILSVGLAPGLTNLLAHTACAALDTVDRVDLLVRLGVGDVHGPAALAWTLDGLNSQFDVPDHGGDRRVRAFTQRRRFRLPTRAGSARSNGRPEAGLSATGYRFDFPEQRVLARTLSVPAASSWLALHPPIAGAALALASRSGTGTLLARPRLRRATLKALTKIHLGSGVAGAVVTAVGLRAGAVAEFTIGVSGRSESKLTAHVAAVLVEQLLTHGGATSGVLHIEQFTEAAPVLAALRANGVLPDVQRADRGDQGQARAPTWRSPRVPRPHQLHRQEPA